MNQVRLYRLTEIDTISTLSANRTNVALNMG